MDFGSLLTVAQKNAKTSGHTAVVCHKLDDSIKIYSKWKKKIYKE